MPSGRSIVNATPFTVADCDFTGRLVQSSPPLLPHAAATTSTTAAVRMRPSLLRADEICAADEPEQLFGRDFRRDEQVTDVVAIDVRHHLAAILGPNEAHQAFVHLHRLA